MFRNVLLVLISVLSNDPFLFFPQKVQNYALGWWIINIEEQLMWVN